MNYGNWEGLAAITHLSNPRVDSLERDFKDLSLHHSKWKALLPPHQNELVLKSTSLIFFVDETTGMNCFLLGAANLIISVPNRFQHLRSAQSFSRLSEVAVLNESRNLDIRGRINTHMLSPNTIYTLHLVFFPFTDAGLLAADSITRVFHDESDYDSKKQEQMVLFKSCHGIADNWMKVEVGYFYVQPAGQDDEVVEVQVQFRNETASQDNRKGLIIEGIEFQPKNRKENTSDPTRINLSSSEDVNNQGSTSTNQIINNDQSIVSRKIKNPTTYELHRVEV